METIVVGVDGSDGACAALEFAVGEAAVVDGSRVKVLAWYEWGYSNRLVELA
jgi:glyceraldehyde-3-phosphate dehydrogenase/erythrose-4-phosphate dehydrogenase